MCVRVLITVLLWACLTIRISPSQLKPPRILEHPSDIVVRKHEPATLNCKADGKPKPTIEWYHGEHGEKVHDTPNRMALPNGELFFLHVIHTKREQDTGIYWCVARNEVGKVKSRNASLEVAVLRDDFRVIPKNVKVAAGETARLECGPPRGHPEPTIKWVKDGDPVNVGTGRIRLDSQGTLVVSDVRQGDKGRYVCVAENLVGSRESPVATLSVHVKPFFIRSPEHITSLSGDQVEFECVVGGDPTPTITWRREDGKMPIGRAQIQENKSLRIKHVLPADEGVYICEAENPVGLVSASASLTVHSRPTFLKTPKDQKVGLNGIAKFECLATGNPPPSVFWTKEGNQVLMFPGRSYGQFSVNQHGTLVISGVTKEDKGYYVCSALSVVGSTMAKAHLEVTAVADLPPPIIRMGPANQTLPQNTVAMLPCEASGTPTPSIRWAFNGAPLSKNNARMVILDSNTLQIDDLQPSDTGVYTCTATSESGETSWSASLSVESPRNPNAIFHRTPDPSNFPGPPSRPRAVNVTETTLALTWRRNSKTGSSPLIGYTIDYYSSDLQSGWVSAAHRVSTETYVVQNLRPDSRYIFLVRAENSHGLSPPSPVSESIRTIGLPDHILPDYDLDEARARLSTTTVELTEVKPISSVSVKLYWNIQGNREYVEGFYIRFRDLSGGSEKYNMVTVLNGAAQSYVLADLRKFTKYEFFLVPFYKSVEGPPSNSRNVQTMEDVPSAPPDNLNIRVINMTSASISWSPPPPQHRNGVLKGFNVHILGNLSSIHSNLSTNATTTVVTLNNLTVGYVYKVQAVAFTTVGPGPFSAPVALRMDLPTASNMHNIQDMVRQPWFIALIGGLLCLLLSIFFVVIFLKRRLAWKKALGAHLSAVPPHKTEDIRSGVNAREALWLNRAWHPPDSDKGNSMSETKLLNKLDSSNDLNYSSVYSPILTNVNAPDYAEVDTHNLSTFYKKEPPSVPAPYATTTLINTPKAFGGSVKDHKSSGSEEASRKSDKGFNMDYGRMLDADGNELSLDAVSPTSDSGSYTTDEYGMPIKKKRLKPLCSRPIPKAPVVNWADLIPPPPEQPPSERGSPPDTPRNQRGPSPVNRGLKPQLPGQIPNGRSPLTTLRGQSPASGKFISPRGTLTRQQQQQPNYYQATQADRIPTPPVRGGLRMPGLTAMLSNRGQHQGPPSPTSGNHPLMDRAIQSSLPSLLGDPHGGHGAGRHDGSLPPNLPIYPGQYQTLDGESDIEGVPGYATTDICNRNGARTPESSVGGDPDYAVTNDGCRVPPWVTDQSNSSCTSARSSGASSSDGSFYTETDFASAVARAAQNAGMRVDGSVVTEPKRNATTGGSKFRVGVPRPSSPYSTDSNLSNGNNRPPPQHKMRKKPQANSSSNSANPPGAQVSDRSNPYYAWNHFDGQPQHVDSNSFVPQSMQNGDDIPAYNKPSFPSCSNHSGSGASQSSSTGRRRNFPVNGYPGLPTKSPQSTMQSDKDSTNAQLQRNYRLDLRDTPIV